MSPPFEGMTGNRRTRGSRQRRDFFPIRGIRKGAISALLNLKARYSATCPIVFCAKCYCHARSPTRCPLEKTWHWRGRPLRMVRRGSTATSRPPAGRRGSSSSRVETAPCTRGSMPATAPTSDETTTAGQAQRTLTTQGSGGPHRLSAGPLRQHLLFRGEPILDLTARSTASLAVPVVRAQLNLVPKLPIFLRLHGRRLRLVPSRARRNTV